MGRGTALSFASRLVLSAAVFRRLPETSACHSFRRSIAAENNLVIEARMIRTPQTLGGGDQNRQQRLALNHRSNNNDDGDPV